ncbi:nuclear transport factor 2 family protein [Mariniflexile sp. HMF6888]|uniref:nuclear transport factor 2 family protein n=1 Tax=Mariniflexile sp. HMF6888 TaxID=3373086 RepID=UPI00379F4D23
MSLPYKFQTKHTLFVLLILTPFLFYSQSDIGSQSHKTIALSYMEAYGDWDFDTMKTFYAENIHFEDPTGSEVFNQKFDFNGIKEVYNFFRGVFKNGFENERPPYVDFRIEKVFESGSFIIINSTFECQLPNAWFKEPSSERILISIPFLTILQIENGKIISHTDYGGYDSYMKQIQAQITNNKE